MKYEDKYEDDEWQNANDKDDSDKLVFKNNPKYVVVYQVFRVQTSWQSI